VGASRVGFRCQQGLQNLPGFLRLPGTRIAGGQSKKHGGVLFLAVRREQRDRFRVAIELSVGEAEKAFSLRVLRFEREELAERFDRLPEIILAEVGNAEIQVDPAQSRLED